MVFQLNFEMPSISIAYHLVNCISLTTNYKKKKGHLQYLVFAAPILKLTGLIEIKGLVLVINTESQLTSTAGLNFLNDILPH